MTDLGLRKGRLDLCTHLTQKTEWEATQGSQTRGHLVTQKHVLCSKSDLK